MPTNDELRMFANEHLTYEIEMLKGVTDALMPVVLGGTTPTTAEDLATRNALLESFAIHTRSIIDFRLRGRAGKTG